MTTDRRTCLACGFEGWRDSEVRMGITEYADPQPVDVAIPRDETRTGPRSIEYRTVPGRYLAGPRCVDVEACRARVASQAASDAVDAFFSGVRQA